MAIAVAALTRELSVVTASLNELSFTVNQRAAEVDRWRTEAEALRAQIAAIRSSISWKLTAPLRVVRRGFFGDAKSGAVGLIRWVLHPQIERTFAAMEKNPTLKARVLGFVRRVPGLEVRVIAMAAARDYDFSGKAPADRAWNLDADPAALQSWTDRLAAAATVGPRRR